MNVISRQFLVLVLVIFGGGFWLVHTALHPSLPSPKQPFIFYATQLRDDLRQVTVQTLRNAKKSICLQIYGLTDPDVIHLLEKKRNEGVDVTIFHDPTASKKLPKSLPAFPVKSGGLMHRKILIVDEKIVLIGTANFTTMSLKMHDNLVLGIYSPSVAQFFSSCHQNTEHFDIEKAEISTFLLPDFEQKALPALIHCIKQAEKEIRIAMFTFTHPLIVHELLHSVKKGVKVSIAIDRNTALGASKQTMETLKKGGAKVLKSTGSQLLHHKWALIDGKTLILGSANWTQSAFTKNQDCLLIINFFEPKMAKPIFRLWKAIANGAEKE